VRVPVDAARVPAGWPGLRIVQISDLHVGPTIRRGYVEAIIEAVSSLDADIIVITGDLVDGFVEQLRDSIEPLRSLRARHGVYFVTGNHEYFYRANEWIVALQSLGIKVLSNRHDIIRHEGAPVLIAGVDDPAADPKETEPREGLLARALAGAPERALSILLAHRPSDAIHAAAQGFDIQLSGHLHGGQFFPLTLLLRYAEPFLAGLYRPHGMWLYVNQGAGYWGPPNRLGARQEIAVLEIGPS
jgi:predicted MPP superfamily phosphohydrolase